MKHIIGRLACILGIGWPAACQFDSSGGGIVPLQDAANSDARVDSMPDTGPPAVDAPSCATTVDGDALAFYDFESLGATLTDATGTFPAVWIGDPAVATTGPDGCGSALGFGDDQESYAIVSASPSWQLDTGSLEFWLRLDGLPDEPRGVISRDALGTAVPGHMTIVVTTEPSITLRIQSTDDSNYLCSAVVLTVGAWHKVSVNWGAPQVELQVDGDSSLRMDAVDSAWLTGTCGTSVFGIAGNDNPWIVGASGQRSGEGTSSPVELYAQSMAIDQLVIRGVRRSL